MTCDHLWLVVLLPVEEQNNTGTTDGEADGQTGEQSTTLDPSEEDSAQPFKHQDMDWGGVTSLGSRTRSSSKRWCWIETY